MTQMGPLLKKVLVDLHLIFIEKMPNITWIVSKTILRQWKWNEGSSRQIQRSYI